MSTPTRPAASPSSTSASDISNITAPAAVTTSLKIQGGAPAQNGSRNATNAEEEVVREQDRYLPIANISRIMKKSLPPNAKIAKDAKETVQECVSEFISFITSEASEKCQQEKRKTINGEDLLWAMTTLGFEKYIEPLKIYLQKYKESVKGEKPDKRGRKGHLSFQAPAQKIIRSGR